MDHTPRAARTNPDVLPAAGMLLLAAVALVVAVTGALCPDAVAAPATNASVRPRRAEWTALPARLTELQAFRDLIALAPAPGGTRYSIRQPFALDGAIARRQAHFPEGSGPTAGDDGEFRFAPGTLFIQTIDDPAPPEGRSAHLETRALLKTRAGWICGTYAWRSDGTEAFLTDGLDRRVDRRLFGSDADYVILGTTSCLRCHGGRSEAVLGFTPAQLEGETPLASPDAPTSTPAAGGTTALAGAR